MSAARRPDGPRSGSAMNLPIVDAEALGLGVEARSILRGHNVETRADPPFPASRPLASIASRSYSSRAPA